MTYKEQMDKWLSSDAVDAKTKEEIKAMNDKDAQESFYSYLEFGTAGLRGVLGAGTNRMNVYTVCHVTQGLAEFIKAKGKDAMERGVAISYDSRHGSTLFAEETAKVLGANGIKVYLSDSLRPVPELSFAVRHFETIAGVMITASHNPAKYNGYKVYGEDGGQMPPENADIVLGYINNTDIFGDVKSDDLDKLINKGLVVKFGGELDRAFIDNVKKQQIHPGIFEKAEDFKVVYTPLHGSGNIPVRMVLNEIGVKNVILVEQQLDPDGSFSTVKSPNPENKEALTLAIQLAKKHDADLAFGTDPDCDRVGTAVKDKNGEYITLTGNMIGALLTHYILSGRKANGTLPDNGIVVKTIVTTYMTDTICRDFGVDVENVLTGFKFIGEKMNGYQANGDYTYLLGFEESYGYLSGMHARDKDGVEASMLITEMAAYYKTKGMNLYDALMELYAKYGTYRERTIALTFEGIEGAGKIKAITAGIRKNPPKEIVGMKVLALSDYAERVRKDFVTGEQTAITLPKADVLLFELENNAWVAVRPSGTEPKIKFYIGVNENSVSEAEAKIDEAFAFINKKFLV
ncbi:MAG: phospho-sugar mutase [Bacillota bacterium]|nr:phospho-sugar mutase [Bacillota bacterium]